ncbi:MAG: hypothetical protein ACLFNM_02760 [Candidatus Woesearchaeota archaeon]
MFDEKDFEEVYNDDGRIDLVDNDQISAEEEGFMQGYDDELFAKRKEQKFSGDESYEAAFAKKRSRRSKRQASFDEEELEAEVLMK